MRTRLSFSRARALTLMPVLALATAMALTGCSPAENGDTAADSAEGPLQKYLSALYGEDDFSQEKLDAQNKKTEGLVAECMKKEGFEYTPNLQNSATFVAPDADSDEPEYGSVEYAEQYGYGLNTWPGGGVDTAPDEQQTYVDPNQEYIESLSESEQTAFSETLYGKASDEQVDDDGNYVYDWKTAGCQGAAQHEVQGEASGVQAANEDPQFTELFEAMGKIYEPFYSPDTPNPDMAELDGKWAACMADGGLDEFTSPSDASNTVMEESNTMNTGDDPASAEGPSDAAKDAFKKREFAVAIADAKCKKQVDYDAHVQKLTFAAEQKFLDEHRDELDALIAQYGTKK